MSTRRKPKRSVKPSSLANAISDKIPQPDNALPTAVPPSRQHAPSYHYPLLLQEPESARALLKWFESIEGERSMPWRKKFIDPADFEAREELLGEVLAKRAYEVWVSEVSECAPQGRSPIKKVAFATVGASTRSASPGDARSRACAIRADSLQCFSKHVCLQ